MTMTPTFRAAGRSNGSAIAPGARPLWIFFFPVIQLARLSRLKGTVPIWGTWTYVNIAVIAVFDLFVLWAFGPNALLYLFFSFWFSVGGLHPLSARWLQEHFAFGPDQGTFDYYGPLNTLALNIGYHNEHHDFHEIPWNRLPAAEGDGAGVL